jgi:hypothetical protein
LPFPIDTAYGAITRNVIKSKEQIAIDNFLTFLAGSILQYVNASTIMYSNLATSVAFRGELKKLIMYCIRFDYILNNNVHNRTNRPALAVGIHINDTYQDCTKGQEQKINPPLNTGALPKTADVSNIIQ